MRYLLIIYLLISSIAFAEIRTLSSEEAIVIAREKAASLNYNYENTRVFAEDDHRFWETYFPKGALEANPNLRNLKELLTKKLFWGIEFYTSEVVLGGSILVFVDKENGQVIDIIPLK